MLIICNKHGYTINQEQQCCFCKSESIYTKQTFPQTAGRVVSSLTRKRPMTQNQKLEAKNLFTLVKQLFACE